MSKYKLEKYIENHKHHLSVFDDFNEDYYYYVNILSESEESYTFNIIVQAENSWTSKSSVTSIKKKDVVSFFREDTINSLL
jgi:hypothetical protein